jgi:hypothetical protein
MSEPSDEIKVGGLTSIGPLIKKINEINPDLNAREVIGIVNQARTKNPQGREQINEPLALELARRTLRK